MAGTRRAASPASTRRRSSINGSSTPPPAPQSGGNLSGSQIRRLVDVLTFLDTFAVGLVNPIYPELVQSDLLGATAFALIMSLANGAALIGSTIYGRISDVRGRRTAILASTATTMLGFALYIVGFAMHGTFPVLRMALPAVGRIIGGMGRSALAGPLLAMLADKSISDDKSANGAATRTVAQDTTRVVASFGFGYATGSGIGGYMVGLGGPWLNLACISVCGCAGMLCAWQLPHDAAMSNTKQKIGAQLRASSNGKKRAPPSSSSSSSSSTTTATALRAALSVRTTRALLLVQALTAASFHVYDSTGAIYMNEHLGYSAPQRGYILSFAGWMFALQTFFVVPRLFALVGRPRTLLCSALVCTGLGRVGLACASLGYPTLAIIASYPVLNFGQAMTHTLLKALMSKAAAAEDRGLLLGVLESVSKSFGVLGPMLGGPLYGRIGPPAPACASCLLALAGALAAAFLAVEPVTTSKKDE